MDLGELRPLPKTGNATNKSAFFTCRVRSEFHKMFFTSGNKDESGRPPASIETNRAGGGNRVDSD